ncbi:thiamine phosphate synthase [Demetria terragena]|uniref:thiamine phosphate synthase n=1 Tax=Demetria terragena TaxID=63959 RepID=UPI00035EE774|nr:thiamine phosphate synthase [Demetria terragena]
MSGRPPLDLSIYLVTSSAHTGRDRLVSTVVAAVEGGVSIVQLREPTATDEVVLDLAIQLVDALAGSDVPLLIDDRVHLVEPSGAAGVHVGQTDMPAAQARDLIGPDRWLGLSAHTTEQARIAEAEGVVDYLGIGPAWPTRTKDTGRDALGPEGIRAVATATPLPSVAIGGIDATRAPRLRDAGVEGIAVVTAICSAPDPQAAARDIRSAWEATP